MTPPKVQATVMEVEEFLLRFVPFDCPEAHLIIGILVKAIADSHSTEAEDWFRLATEIATTEKDVKKYTRRWQIACAERVQARRWLQGRLIKKYMNLIDLNPIYVSRIAERTSVQE